MNAILLSLALISADYPDYGYAACWRRDASRCGYWGYAVVVRPYSPWNAAVAELRARGPSRSRDRWLPPSTANHLQELDLQRSELYSALIAAPKAEKAELRRQWLAARQELERARLLASKEVR